MKLAFATLVICLLSGCDQETPPPPLPVAQSPDAISVPDRDVPPPMKNEL